MGLTGIFLVYFALKPIESWLGVHQALRRESRDGPVAVRGSVAAGRAHAAEPHPNTVPGP